jgi:KaiC/GvpD/RAD55 family RecA-like ATPase
MNSPFQAQYDKAEPITLGSPVLMPTDLSAFLALEFPPREMLLGPWLPRQGLAMIYAARGVGKTHLALAAAYAVATGGGFLSWRAPAPRRVLLIDGEMPGIALQERLKGLAHRAGAALPEADHFRILAADTLEAGLPDLSSEDGQEMLAPAIGDADLIVLDNLSTLCRSGKENEAESWASVQHWSLAQRRAGRSVLYIHHAGKGGDQRGTSRREDVLDTVIRLDRPENYDASQGARFNVVFTKARGLFGDDAAAFEARLGEDGTWIRRPVADVRAERVIALNAEGFSQREIAREVEISAATVNRILKRREAGSDADQAEQS